MPCPTSSPPFTRYATRAPPSSRSSGWARAIPRSTPPPGRRPGTRARSRAASGAGRTQGALQGALGLIDRARFARTIDVGEAEALARTLFALTPGGESALDRAVARWVETALLPGLARGVYGAQAPGDAETTVLRAMAGDRLERAG